MKAVLFILGALVASYSSHASEQFAFPDKIDKNTRYVFYSHGYIVEGGNPTPVHPRWGTYDFPAIKSALADPDYHLIATHRPAGTSPFVYAEKLAAEVTTLVNNGVPASNIALIGFSRGGFITVITTGLLRNDKINIVLLAACNSRLAKRQDIRLYGHLLSVYETSDSVGSCEHLVDAHQTTVRSFQEVALSTGKEHGAFYTPEETWLAPVKNWLKHQFEPGHPD